MQDKNIYNGMLIENQKVYNNYDVSNLDKIKIEYGLIGKLDNTYRITFCMDNIPIYTTEMEVRNNRSSWLSMYLNVKDMNENTSFYAIAVPANYHTNSDREQSVVKSSSILLYKK